MSEELRRACSTVLVAQRSDGGAGALAGVAVAWAVAGDCQLLELGVCPRSRGRGLGTALLEAVAAETLRGGDGTVLLEVRVSNAAARRLYARLGFVEAGRRKAYYRDGEDAVLCSRPAARLEDSRQELRQETSWDRSLL